MPQHPLTKKLCTLIITLYLILILTLTNTCQAQNTQQTYKLLDQPDGTEEYNITLTTPQNLYLYYLNKEHTINNIQDLSKFVTPYPLEPLANDLWSIYNNQEDYANAVLMITHQIPYKESSPQKYPIETITENEGDCDLLSFLAASILKAGGIDTVLLFYEKEEHMAIGVNLQTKPKNARSDIYYYTYEDQQYYIAETTGNFEYGWRIGECPDTLKEAQAQIIPLNNMELLAPTKISTNYSNLQQSSLQLSIPLKITIAPNHIEITGSLNPALEGKNITLYISPFGSKLTKLNTVQTDANGRYFYIWDSPPGGVYSISAHWPGDSNYAGADNTLSQVVIIPIPWLMIGIITFSIIILLTVSIITHSNTEKTNDIEDWKPNEY